jgi:sirohydrochlorin cobaltochelatase
MAVGLILFAHGARDLAWAAPFERVLVLVAARAPERAPMLAYLERMSPDLLTAVAQQVARGFRAIRIVPLFLGPGGHLRDDVPRLVDDARRVHPDTEIERVGPAGEDAGVIAALASYCLA